MGYINSASTIEMTAKLTKLGREKLMNNSSNVFAKFSIGDSDSNYQTTGLISTGLVPEVGGDGNNLNGDFDVKYKVYIDGTNNLYKTVTDGSSDLVSELNNTGLLTVSGSNLTFIQLDRTNTTSELTNLFMSVNLPLIDSQKTLYSQTNSLGGYSDTAFSGFNEDDVILVGIDSSQYGELIDGKAIKLDVPIYTAGTSGLTVVNCYSTYMSTTTSTTTQDKNVKDTSTQSKIYGDNIAFIFSDYTQKPNNDSSKSWATGYNNSKPFSLHSKELFNYKNDTTQSKILDVPIGIAYLDKGFIALTHPSIVDNFAFDQGTANTKGLYTFPSSASTLQFDSLSYNINVDVICIADRKEFYRSNNLTFNTGDTIRISEIGLYDNDDNLLALAKFDRHITKTINDYKVFKIKISL